VSKLFTFAAIGLLFAIPGLVQAQTIQVDQQVLQQLQETIRQQQHHLQQQADQLQQQAELLRSLQQQVQALQKKATPVPAPPSPGQAAITAATPAKPLPVAVASGNEAVKLAISGQINRAVLVANDGYNSTLYHVDNTVSNSRFRLVGTARPSQALTIGTRLEIAVSPDRSSAISQQNKYLSDTYFDQRWLEISFESTLLGKLSIGKGDTASNTTAEVDLSRTDVVQYASLADMGGGLLFRSRNAPQAFIPNGTSQLKVSDVFKSYDGLSRQSRLRYDSPSLFGFHLAGSLVSGQRSDIALLWGQEGYGFKMAGAFAVSNPKSDAAGLLYDGSCSLLHQATGLNLTLSGGLQEQDLRQDSTSLYAKLGWLSRLTSLGYTAFGIDYSHTEHAAAQGDKGNAIGAAVVQALDNYATELYLLYRAFSVDRGGTAGSVATINMGIFGARVKF